MRKLTYQEIFDQRPSVADLDKVERLPMYCLAENIRSLYNVGSIFRTSDAVLLDTLYLAGYTGFPPRKEIDKTALGAVDTVNWLRFENPIEAVNDLKSRKIPLIALEHTSHSIPYTDFNFPYPFCLMLGNEVEGITDDLLAHADAAIEIPMLGVKHSLNVSVAYGIVIYHAMHQYLLKSHAHLQG